MSVWEGEAEGLAGSHGPGHGPGYGPGHGPLAGAGAACRTVEMLVAAALSVPVAAMRAGGRGTADVSMARQAAMYLAHVGLGLSLSDVGRHFGRDRTTVAYACARIEDLRDDPLMESAMAFLEEALELCLEARWQVRGQVRGENRR